MREAATRHLSHRFGGVCIWNMTNATTCDRISMNVILQFHRFDSFLFLVENFFGFPKKKVSWRWVNVFGCVMWLERAVVELMLWNIFHMEKRGEITWFQVVMEQKPIPTEDAPGETCENLIKFVESLMRYGNDWVISPYFQGDLGSWAGQHLQVSPSTVGLALSNDSKLGSA